MHNQAKWQLWYRQHRVPMSSLSAAGTICTSTTTARRFTFAAAAAIIATASPAEKHLRTSN